MDKINLFKKMIKYHPTFIGWLISENKIEKDNDCLVIHDNSKKDDVKFIEEYNGEVIEIYSNGVKRLYGNYGYVSPNFTQIKVGDYTVFKKLSNAGIDVFDIGNRSERYCLTSKIGLLLKLFHSDILDINIQDSHPRLKGEDAINYIKYLENKINYIKERDYKFGSISKYGFIGIDGFAFHQPKVIENIKKYGIFAYSPIYDKIEWTFDLVEKFKEHIVWYLLMNKSNLIWDEEQLIKYDKYIPYCTEKNDTYCDKYYGNVFDDYSKMGFISNHFIETHKNVINWEKLLEKGFFSWSDKELKYFCKYALSIDMPYSNSFKEPASSQILYSFPKLLGNKNFKWDQKNLLAFLQLDTSLWDSIISYKNIYKLFLSIPNIKELAQPYVTKEKFWETVSYIHDFNYDELSEEFTIENIEKNKEHWSNAIENKFIGMQRTPDTNYHYYWVRTKWDDMSSHLNIPINYELCKYLKTITITLGGTYCKSDGGTLEEDHRYPEFNGLHLFTHHHFENMEEMDKVIDDDELLDDFFSITNSYNIDLIEYMCESFFKTTTIKEYIEIINQMKDWDDIREIKE